MTKGPPPRSTVIRLDQQEPQKYLKIFLAGKPKSAGKTTFALTLPGEKLILNYDLGMVSHVPGVDASEITIIQYPTAQPTIHGDNDRWKRATNIGERVILDIEEIRSAFIAQRPITIDNIEIVLPDVLILDGLTELQAIVLDWVLGVNAKTDPEDFDNKYAAWRKRLNVMRTLFNMVIPLPCTVVLIAWESAEMTGGKDPQPTGRTVPDIGGRLDNIIPGKVDAALRCYAKYIDNQVRYFVQCAPDAIRDWVGVRGRYDQAKEVDVTLGPERPLPARRVFETKGPLWTLQ